MKRHTRTAVVVIVIVALVAAWMVHFHTAMIATALPKWAWLQSAVKHLGAQAADAPADDEDPDNAKNEIPVHTARVTTATLHRYIDAFGMIIPRPARADQMAGSANIASPVTGVVAKVLCQIGQNVHAGDPLVQLDDRLARSAEDQASAALTQAQASLAALKATPRPDQLEIAELAVEKAQSALEFAQHNFDRQKQLAEQQVTSGKSLQQAATDLAAARDDLAVSQRQLAILKSSPTPEDLAQEQAKVAQANAALATARIQRQLANISAPIDATVVAVSINPGEAVDTTKTLVQLVAMDRLMVDVDVPADQLPADPVNLPVQVLTTAPGGKAAAGPSADVPHVGKIAYVSPQVDPHTGAMMVGVELAPGPGIRPGLTVAVRIVTEQHKDVLAVPREAVVTDENGDSVIAVVENDQATHKTVKVGLEENGLIEINADGLVEGAVVVTAGAFGLPQATRVKVVD